MTESRWWLCPYFQAMCLSVLRDRMRVHGHVVICMQLAVQPISLISISPSNTLTAGPVIVTASALPAQATISSPPRADTLTGESSKPRRMPATTAAQAPPPRVGQQPL